MLVKSVGMNQILIRPEECPVEQGEISIMHGRRAAALCCRSCRYSDGRYGPDRDAGGRARYRRGDRATGRGARCTLCVAGLGPRSHYASDRGITLLLMALPRPKVVRRLIRAAGRKWRRDGDFLRMPPRWNGYILIRTGWHRNEYEPLMLEGLEQSGETHLPVIRVVRRLKPLVEDELARVGGHAAPAAPGRTSTRPLLLACGCRHPCWLRLGRRAGWTDYEVDLFRTHGFTCVTLGERVLRSDIAVHAMLGIVQ
jgi:hypothetical protein